MAEPMTVQTVIFSKERYKGTKGPRKWLSSHGHSVPAVDETDSSYRFRQKDPGEFKEGTLRTVTFKGGVKAVVGKLR